MFKKEYVVAAIVGLVFLMGIQAQTSFATALFPSGGGTGISSTSAGNVGNCLKVSSSSPFTYTLGTCGSGGGTVGPSTSTFIAVFNASGTLAGFINLTYVSSTNTFTVGGTASTSLSGSTGVPSVIGDRLHLTDIYGDTVDFNGEASFGFNAATPEFGLQIAGLNSTSTVSLQANNGGGVAVQDISQVNGTQSYIWPTNGGWIVVGTSTVVNHCVKWTGTSTIGDSGSACGGTSALSTSSPITINNFPFWASNTGQLSGTSTVSASGTTVMQNGVLQIAKLTSATSLSLSQAAGGTLATSSYFFEVTAVDVNNVETPVSAEVTTTTPANTSTLTLSWTHVPGVSFYKAYIATTTGAESLYATTTINSFAFSTTTINGAAGPKATSTPPSVNNTIFAQIGTATSSIGPIFGKCGLLINTTTPCNNQNTQEDLTLGNGTVSIGGGTLTFRAVGGGSPTLTSGSDLNVSNSSGQKIAFTSGGTMVFSTAASTPGTYTFGLVTTTTNSMNMNGQANFNALNVTSTATLGSTTINGQATTTNLSVTAVTSSPLAVSASGLLERMTITTTTQSNLVRYDSTTTVTVANNTSASTTFYTLSVPSGTLDNTGKQFIITAGGTFTYAGPSNTNLSLWLLYGGQTCISKSTGALTTSTAQGSWFATFHIGNASGSTSFQDCDIFSAEAGGSAGNIVSASSTAVDSTVTQNLVLKMQMNNANASNTIVANLVNVVLNYVTSTVVTGFSFN